MEVSKDIDDQLIYICPMNYACPEDDSMGRHHMGPNRMHPDRSSCLNLTTNDSVGWQTKCFPAGWATKVTTSIFSKFSRWVLVLRQFMGGDFSGAPSGEFSELPCQSPQLSNTGKYTPSRAGQIRKYTLSRRIYYLISKKYLSDWYWPVRPQSAPYTGEARRCYST